MDLPGPLAVFLSAMTPIGELRLAIPLAMYQYDQPWYQAFLLSIAGNLVPVPFLLWGLGVVGGFLLSFPNPVGRLLGWRARRLHTGHANRFRRYGAWALIPFVAIPLPMTGAWTGCLAAWVFEIPPRRALPFIVLGVLIAGVVVTVLTQLSISFPFLHRP